MRAVFYLALALAVSGALFFAAPARAEEFIASFAADITVSADASLDVTETITANVEGRDIRRGLTRDFPLYALDDNGRRTRVDFDLISVERDGRPEPYHTESISGGIRIFTGSADVLLPRGLHTFTIRYKTGRQIRTFDDHDELYWNVTGTGWIFPIRKASAAIRLPDGISATRTTYYTGAYGSRDANARVTENRPGHVAFETTRALPAGAGLTIVVGLPKGAVAADAGTQQRWWLRDNAGTLIGMGGLALVTLFYLVAWIRVGRDPARGVIVPRWDPPEGLSPALVNYVDNKGFSGQGWTAFSASLLDLAVKGFVVLDDLKNSITVRRTDKRATGPLPAGQQSILQTLGEPGSAFVIEKANGKAVETAGNRFRKAIESEHRGKYYRFNRLYVIGGVLLSVAVLAALAIFAEIVDEVVPALFAISVATVIFGSIAVRLGRSLRPGASLAARLFGVIGIAVFGFVALAAILGFLAVVVVDLDHEQLPLAIGVSGIILANALFFFLMGAPTPLGRRLMDGIEGLRIYLTLAEKDRLNMQGAPQMSPSHFETLLPYAVALGVEKPWTRTFETWLASAAAGAAAAAYHPAWYGGSYSDGFSDRIGNLSNSMASTLAASLPDPPKSSSSGFSSGGGFSGGGGGGGGGGGW